MDIVRKEPHHGWIEVITGSMFSGKSEELIRRLRRAQIARQKVQIFKPIIDDRFGEPLVERRLEDLHFLAGNLGAAQPADELFALAAEHAAGNDFNPAVGGRTVRNVHVNQTRD